MLWSKIRTEEDAVELPQKRVTTTAFGWAFYWQNGIDILREKIITRACLLLISSIIKLLVLIHSMGLSLVLALYTTLASWASCAMAHDLPLPTEPTTATIVSCLGPSLLKRTFNSSDWIHRSNMNENFFKMGRLFSVIERRSLIKYNWISQKSWIWWCAWLYQGGLGGQD